VGEHVVPVKATLVAGLFATEDLEGVVVGGGDVIPPLPDVGVTVPGFAFVGDDGLRAEAADQRVEVSVVGGGEVARDDRWQRVGNGVLLRCMSPPEMLYMIYA
jgi:hypothetical protein